MSQPLVSILINNYNYERFVGEAIDSALAQTYSNVEIIVVDDGSTDQSHDVLARYKDRVRVIEKPNGGQASAFNAGFAASRGQIICFLDADDVFRPDKAAVVAEQLADAELKWCYDQVVRTDETLSKPMGDAPSGNIYTCDYREAMRAGRLSRALRMPIPPTSGLSFKREILQTMFPLYESESCSMSENFMKTAAIGIAKGVSLDMGLTLQRVHGSNLFTFTKEANNMSARISLLTGYWLAKVFPGLKKFADTQIALGMAQMANTTLADKYYGFLREYMAMSTLADRLKMHARSLYYRVKYRL